MGFTIVVDLRARVVSFSGGRGLRHSVELTAETLYEAAAMASVDSVLKGDQAGRHSIRVNDQYRVTFRWENGHAYEVRVEDYH